MFQRNAGLVLVVLVALLAPTLKAAPPNFPGIITQTAPNQAKAHVGDVVCFFTAVDESIQVSCKNNAHPSQTFSGTSSFFIGDCHSGGFLSNLITWSFCRVKNPHPGAFDFSFDLIANVTELTGDLLD